EVGPVCLDPELRRLRQRFAVGVDADDVVSLRIGAGEGAVPATEVEHAATGPAHVLPEERLALRPREDESRAPLAAVVLGVLLDLGGLVLGIYVALIFRELYLGQWPPLWGILWNTESDWLPFLTVITVLVFWVGGLYRRRELRAGLGQIVFSLVLVAVITLAF